MVELFLGLRAFIYHNGVIEVASANQSGLQQRFYIANEHESARRGNFFGEIGKMVEGGILIVKDVRVEIHFHIDAELVVGQEHQLRACFRVYHFHFVAHIVEILVGSLLHKTHTVYAVDERLGASVKNRNLGAVNTYQAVIHSERVESSHGMLYGAYCYIAFANHRATLGSHYVFCKGIDSRRSFEVDTLNLISVVIGCGAKCSLKACSCMKALAFYGELSFECYLLHCDVCGMVYCYF